jgi:hypothetical protein
MNMSEVPLYSKPYKGKPRFFLEGLLRDDDNSTTTSNVQIMIRNADFLHFHSQPFPKIPPPSSPTSDNTDLISLLTSPSSTGTSTSTSTSEMPSTTLEVATQKVLKQIQYLISYVCYEVMFARKQMKKKEMTGVLYELYHGDVTKPHLIHHAHHFSQGLGKYKDAMDRSRDDGYLQISQELTQEKEFQFVINEVRLEDVANVITLSLIKSKTIKSDVIFSGRSVQTYADDAIANCKKATAFSARFIQDGNLPSGWSRTTFINKILDLMYENISSEPKSKKIVDGDEREELFTKQRPKGWVFNGFMAYILYGPLATANELKSNLMSGSKLLIICLFIYLFDCLFIHCKKTSK